MSHREEAQASSTACLCKSSGSHWVLILRCILFPCGSNFLAEPGWPISMRAGPFPLAKVGHREPSPWPSKFTSPVPSTLPGSRQQSLALNFQPDLKVHFTVREVGGLMTCLQTIQSQYHTLRKYLIRVGQHIAGDHKV